MAVIIRCTKCNSKVRAVESVRSKTFRCPKCGKKLRLADSGEVAPPDPLVGRKFAHYEVEEKVGEGAMASVYRARNLRLDKTVALKVISDHAMVGPLDLTERFLAEARSAASLDHTNVLSVFFVGKYEDRYFIEMQYADGGTVREALNAKGKFDVREAARIARDAARGLAAAHKKKIIHRDIKPQNLMMTSEGSVKVADFGLAKLQDAEKQLTAAGLVVGTPLYMSPEQVAGKPADERSDIYSLGIAFFEMLTGRPPFDAPSPAVILHMHVYEPMPSPQIYLPELPDNVCSIVAKMTRKKPEHRYQSCDELVKDLDRLLAGSGSIPAVEEEKVAEGGAGIEVDNLSIFHTMARYAFSSSDAQEDEISDLRKKAEELGISKEEANRIISTALSDRKAAEAAARKRAPAEAPGLQAEAAKLYRRQRAEKFLASLAAFGVLVAVLAVLFGGFYAIRAMVQRNSDANRMKQQKEEEGRRIANATRVARDGKNFESQGNWDSAIASYRDSLMLREDDEVKERLAVVLQVLDAVDLDKQKKWDAAEKALADVLPKTLGQNHVLQRLERVRTIKQYEAAYAKAKAACDRKDWSVAAESFRQAAELAHNARMPSDAADLAASVQKKCDGESDRRARMEWLISMCKSKKTPYAALVIAGYYLSAPGYERYRDDMTKAREEAKVAIDSLNDSDPNDPIQETNDLCVVKLKKGEVLYGKLVGKRENAIEVEPLGEEKSVRRLIHSLDIESTNPITAKEINDSRAEQVYAAVLASWKAHHPFETLRLMGRLMVKFPQSAILSNPNDQKARFGLALSDLQAKAIAECEAMCPVCEGVGSIACDECNGKGQKTVECQKCKNPLRLPRCEKCRGTGLRIIGLCDECGGTGKIKCKRCNGKGCAHCEGKGKWDCRACNGTGKGFATKKCTVCKGVGTIGAMQCPKCFGKGKPACPDCKGTGRQECPDCKGTGTITFPCAKCNATGRLVCPQCKGSGKR